MGHPFFGLDIIIWPACLLDSKSLYGGGGIKPKQRYEEVLTVVQGHATRRQIMSMPLTKALNAAGCHD